VSLLLPFGSYVLADRVGASGILAAATAGIVMSYEELAGRALAGTRIRRAAVWDALQFAGNGVVFVLLGQQLTGVISRAVPVMHQMALAEGWVLAYVAAISVALFALRWVWAWLALRVIVWRAAGGQQARVASDWRLVAATALAGVRGAVTLSGVMTLPLVLRDGSPFPTRDLVILLAAGVIVVSLAAANVLLPYALSGIRVPVGALDRREEGEARCAAARAAIEAVGRAMHDAPHEAGAADAVAQAGARLIAHYREQIELHMPTVGSSASMLKIDEAERRLRVLALGAERDELYRMSRAGRLADERVRDLVREVDLQESRFTASFSRK
jgi:monovalent cation/hydrogen antiporter